MNIVLLSPHFPAQQYHYAQALKAQGARVFGLGDEPIQGLSAELAEVLDGYFYVSDLHHYDELLRTCGQITWHHGKIDRLESLNEYWLETEAALRSDFNIPGLKDEQMPAIKEKAEMKRLFQAHGVPCAAGILVGSLQQALDFGESQGYPLVLKPNIGVGASQTFKIADADSLRTYLSGPVPRGGWMLEAYIAGEIFTFDGLCDRSGHPVFYTSMVYSDGVMEVVNSDDHVAFYTLREIPADLEALGRQLLGIFPVQERFFHFEFFRQHSDKSLKALEVNLRPAGGPSVDMYNFAHDIDLYHEWANIVLHNHFNTRIERKYFCAYAGRKAHKPYRHSHDAIVARWHHLLLEADTLPGVFRRAMGDYFYLLRSPDEREVLDAIAFIQAC